MFVGKTGGVGEMSLVEDLVGYLSGSTCSPFVLECVGTWSLLSSEGGVLEPEADGGRESGLKSECRGDPSGEKSLSPRELAGLAWVA